MRYLFLLALASLPAFSALQIVSGNGQMVFEQYPATRALVVRAVDTSGRPLANVPVTWSVSPLSGGTARPVNGNDETNQNQTDANGYAEAELRASSIQPGTSYMSANVLASSPEGNVTFAVTTIARRGVQPLVTLVADDLSATTGSILENAVRVKVTASSGISAGTGIPNVGISVVMQEGTNPDRDPTVACDGPAGTALTDAQGWATCRLVVGRIAGFTTFQMNAGGMVTTRAINIDIKQGQAQMCSYAFTPAIFQFDASAGAGSFGVTTQSGCPVNPVSNANWITITGSSQTAVNFSVGANTGPARNGTISVGSQQFTVSQAASTAGGVLSVVTTGLSNAVVGTPYTATLSSAGGTAPLVWTSGTTLPAGLSLNSSTGVISGTPTTAGTYELAITVRDSAGRTAAQTLMIVVLAAGSAGGTGTGNFTITTVSLPNGTIGAPYSAPVSATGGCQNPFSGGPRFEVAAGALPAGVSLATSESGIGYVVAGTPRESGTFSFVLRAVDSCGNQTTRQLALSIAGGVVTPAMTLPGLPSSGGLSFTWMQGTPATDQRIFTVDTGGASVTFALDTSNIAGNWLQVTADRSATPATVTARLASGLSLQPGRYTGTLVIRSQAPNSPITIPLSLTVVAPSAIALASDTLSFEAQSSVTPTAPQAINVTSTGAPLRFTASSRTPWLTVSPQEGATPAVLIVRVVPGMPAGVHTGTIIIQPEGGASAVNVTVTLRVAQRPAEPQLRISSILNAANFREGGVAPGQIVTIKGENIGPSTLTLFQLTPEGRLDTTLATVKVWFDEALAPIVHASSTQVSVVVPYSVWGKSTVRLQLEYNGAQTAVMQLPVVESAPGLFAIGGTDRGAILNQDNTLNSAANPAEPGTIIQLFATGEGQTDPGGVEGAVMAPATLAKPRLPVTVTIGGRLAQVIYAGSAPGMIAGVMQVNVRVPEAVSAGAQQVVLTVGNASSQPVTVDIR